MSSLSFTEMKALALAALGPEWQSPLARALEIEPRTIRRWVADQTCPDWLTREKMAAALGLDAGAPIITTPDDEWIYGEGIGGPDPARRYVVHTLPPRFIARAVEAAAFDVVDDPIFPAADGSDGEPPYDELSPLVFSGRAVFLTEVVWLDQAPAFEIARKALSKAAALFPAPAPHGSP